MSESTALAERQDTSIADVQQTIDYLVTLGQKLTVYHYEGKPELTEKSVTEIANRLGFDTVETDHSASTDTHWHITAKVLNPHTGRHAISGASEAKSDPKGFAKAMAKAVRNANNKLIPMQIRLQALTVLTGAKPPPSQQPKNATNESRAFAAANPVVKKLKEAGIEGAKDVEQAMWDYFKDKYGVESRTQFATDGQQYAEIATRLNACGKNDQAFNQLVFDIRNFINKAANGELTHADIARNHIKSNEPRFRSFLGNVTMKAFWDEVGRYFKVNELSDLTEQQWDMIIVGVSADNYSSVSWMNNVKKRLQGGA